MGVELTEQKSNSSSSFFSLKKMAKPKSNGVKKDTSAINKSGKSINNMALALSTLYSEYMKTTVAKLKLIDLYLLYILLTGIAQFAYCCIVGTFPFNSFLAGFISCVASFILGVNLRMQVNQKNAQQFDHILPERAFADFLFAHVILHLVVANFIG